FTEYGERLERAGHALQQHVPYGYGTFDNGVAVPAIARALLRDVDPESRRWHDPFLTAGDDSFYSWITHADGGGSDPFIPRIAVAVWESRVDLRQVFPAPRGPSRLGFARWLVGNLDHGL